MRNSSPVISFSVSSGSRRSSSVTAVSNSALEAATNRFGWRPRHFVSENAQISTPGPRRAGSCRRACIHLAKSCRLHCYTYCYGGKRDGKERRCGAPCCPHGVSTSYIRNSVKSLSKLAPRGKKAPVQRAGMQLMSARLSRGGAAPRCAHPPPPSPRRRCAPARRGLSREGRDRRGWVCLCALHDRFPPKPCARRPAP